MEQPGGGYKVNLLREELQHLKDYDDLVVLFSDRLVHWLEQTHDPLLSFDSIEQSGFTRKKKYSNGLNNPVKEVS